MPRVLQNRADSMGLVDKSRYLQEEPFDFDGQDENVQALYADVPTYMYKPGELGYPASSLTGTSAAGLAFNCDLERSLLAAAQTDLDTVTSTYIQTHVSSRYVDTMSKYLTNLTVMHTFNVQVCDGVEETADTETRLVQHTSLPRSAASRLSQAKRVNNHHAQKGRVHVLTLPQVNAAGVADITRAENSQRGEYAVGVVSQSSTSALPTSSDIAEHAAAKAPASVGTDNEAARGGDTQHSTASAKADGDRGKESIEREIASEVTVQETKVLTPDQVLGQ